MAERRLKCFLTQVIHMKRLSHKLQQNCFISQCASEWSFNSSAVRKRFGHSRQTYGFTTSCRRMCLLRWSLRLNFFSQTWHLSQVAPSCDFSRCVLSWSICVKRSEHWPHEYSFAPVWVWTWRFMLQDDLNVLPQYVQRYGLLLLCVQFSCIRKPRNWLKLLLQSEHLYALSPACSLTWSFRCANWPNTLLHMWHLYGFFPLWILLCTVRLSAHINCLLQTLQWNGFSPEWLRLCVARRLWLRKHLPHSVHVYFPVWIFLWWLRLSRDVKHFPHSLQEYIFSTLCTLLCLFRNFLLKNRLLHTLHKYGLGLTWGSVISSDLISNGRDLSVLSATVSRSIKLPAYTQKTKVKQYTNKWKWICNIWIGNYSTNDADECQQHLTSNTVNAIHVILWQMQRIYHHQTKRTTTWHFVLCTLCDIITISFCLNLHSIITISISLYLQWAACTCKP